MSVFEIARQLGEALREDEKYKTMEATRKAFEENEELQSRVRAYAALQKQIQEKAGTPSPDTREIEQLQEQANRMYSGIVGDPVYAAARLAEDEVNELMNAVNRTITYSMTGSLPDSCTHDCSSCHGCH